MRVFGVSLLTILIVAAAFYIGRKTNFGSGLLPVVTG